MSNKELLSTVSSLQFESFINLLINLEIGKSLYETCIDWTLIRSGIGEDKKKTLTRRSNPCLRARWARRSEGSWRSIFSRWSSRINAPTSHRVHHAFDFLFRPMHGSQTKSDAFSFDPTNFPRILPASIFLSIRLFFFSTIPEFRDPFVSDQDAIILDSVCKNNSYYFKVINNGNGIDLLKSVALWEQSILTTEIGI